MNNDSAMHDLTICIENLLYEAHLRSGADCDVLTATPIRTRTTGDLHAIKDLAPHSTAATAAQEMGVSQLYSGGEVFELSFFLTNFSKS